MHFQFFYVNIFYNNINSINCKGGFSIQDEEKLIFVKSDILFNEELFEALRKKVTTLTNDEIHNFMYFNYNSNTELYPDITIAILMTITDTSDFSPHPTEIIKDIRKSDFILMSFKTLKQFLSL